MESGASCDASDLDSVLAAAIGSPCGRELLEALPVAIYITDAAGRLTYFNRAAVALSGRIPELGTEKWCVTWKLYYPDGRPMPHDECPMAVALRECRPIRGEQAIAERPDGTRFWFEPSPSPIFDSAGNLIGGVNMLLDITDRKRDEEKLLAREAELASEADALSKLNELSSRLWQAPTLCAGLEEMLAATIELLGADMGNVQMLDSNRKVLRIAAQRGFQQPFLDFFREVSLVGDSACGRALRSGERIVIEDVEVDVLYAPLRAAARAAGYRAVQSTPLIGRDGVPLGMLSTHSRAPHRPDAQALRRLDLYVRQAVDFIERKQVEESLRGSEERFRAFISTTTDVVYCMTADWTEMRHLQGRDYIADTLEPSRTWLDKYIPPVDQARVQQAIRTAIASKSNFELEHRVIRVDGSLAWTYSRAIPILDENGEIIEWFGTASDVTQRRAAEEALQFREQIMVGQREALELAIYDAPLDESLDVLVRTVIEGIGQDARAGFYLANAEKTAIHHVVGMGPDYAKAVDGITIGPDSVACGLATHTGKPILTSDVRNEPKWQPWLWMAEKFDYRACWSFPIQTARERFIGTLAVYSRQPREATARDIEICRLITNTASLIISRHADAAVRREMEQSLRQSEQRHRKTLDLMPAAVYSCDATGALTYFNQQAAELWGRAPEIGDTNERFCGSEQLVLPDGTILPHEECPMAVALRDGQSFRNAEVRIRQPGGSLLPVMVNIDPVCDDQGAIVGAISAFIDVSAIKQAEEILRQSESRFRNIFACSNDAIFVIDPQSNSILDANPRASEMLGYTHEELLSLSISAIHPQEMDKLQAFAEKVFDRGQGWTDELSCLTKSGCALPAEISASRFVDMNGRNCLLALVRDITERKAAERALREGEERFRMLADNIDQLAWTCDQKLGNVTWYNQRWLEYTGLTFEEMQQGGWEKVQHTAYVDQVVASIRRAAETGDPWEHTFPLRGADGTFRWFLSRAVPIRDEKGDIVRWFGTNTDVTEQREAEEALKEADRRKDEFLATLAHELRNPLAPIRNSLHILRLTGSDGVGAERIHEMMDRQVNHMVRLVDDLMEVSRITRGKIELRREPINLADVVRSAVETSRPLIDAARHQLTISLPPEPLILEADPVRLGQILANLLNNAAKYTEEGGHIRLTVELDSSTAVMSVRDTGMGIPAAMLPKVFDLFTQVDRTYSRSQGGLGIGLTLVRNLVTMHGGTIEAKSDGPGRGSEFVVRLPVATGQPGPHNGDQPNERPAAVSTRRILVVDDNRDSAESLAMLLKFLGADVYTANDGLAALQALQKYRPAVALLDIGMPGMDGYEVARQARLQTQGRDVTLIALTGWGQDEDRRRSKEAGFDHHLVKPVDLGALQVLLESLPQSSIGS